MFIHTIDIKNIPIKSKLHGMSESGWHMLREKERGREGPERDKCDQTRRGKRNEEMECEEEQEKRV